MPLYEYECSGCGTRIERIQKFSDPPLTTCEKCGGGLKRLLSSPALQFKGSGWYVTDYARKTPPETSKSESPASGESWKGPESSKAPPSQESKSSAEK